MIRPQQNRHTCQFPEQRNRHAPALLLDDCYLSYRALCNPGSCLLRATTCLKRIQVLGNTAVLSLAQRR